MIYLSFSTIVQAETIPLVKRGDLELSNMEILNLSIDIQNKAIKLSGFKDQLKCTPKKTD